MRLGQYPVGFSRNGNRPTHAAEDAGKGAGIGAAVGGVGGLLTGLGLLAIPGVRPVVAAGWLVATAAGAATGAVVGGAAGGLVGSLTGAGVPERDAQFYAEGVRRAAPSSQPESMTPAHRQPGKSSNATRRWIQPFVARHIGKAAGIPSTKTHRLTRPTKSQRSGPAIAESASSCFELTAGSEVEVPLIASAEPQPLCLDALVTDDKAHRCRADQQRCR
jgi:hypothetical protein